jgi:hypothetical protein
MLTKALHNFRKWAGAEGISSEGAVTVLDNASITLGRQASVGIDKILCLDDIHLPRKSDGTLVSSLVDGEVVVLLVGPSPLHTTRSIVLGVKETRDGVRQTRIDDTTRYRGELSGSVLASGNLTLVPKSPLSARMPGKVATLCSHENVVVDFVIFISQREEV